MKVKECMCNHVWYVSPETTVNQVAQLMSQKHVGSIPVCDSNKEICGIITDRDILLRAIAGDKDLQTCKVKDIMTQNVCTCMQDDDMENAQQQMAKNQIRRLPVCDDNNHVVGILTLGDLVQNDKKIGEEEAWNTFSNICNCNGKNAE